MKTPQTSIFHLLPDYTNRTEIEDSPRPKLRLFVGDRGLLERKVIIVTPHSHSSPSYPLCVFLTYSFTVFEQIKCGYTIHGSFTYVVSTVRSFVPYRMTFFLHSVEERT